MRPLSVVTLALAAAAVPADAQTFTRIIGTGDPAPGTAAPILTFSEPPGLDGDHIAFLASHQEPGGAFVETVYSNATGSFQKVIATGDTMPGHTVPLEFLIRLAVDGDDVAVNGSAFAGAVIRTAILSNAGGAVANVLDKSQFIPGTFTQFSQLAGQDFSFGRGEIVVNGSGPNGHRGLYAVDATGGPVTVVADSNMVAPGSGGATYFTFSSPGVRHDRVAFASSLSGQTAVFDQLGVGTGAITRMIGSGDAAPSGQTFTLVYGPVVDEDDTLFYGIESNGVRGLYAFVNGALTTVVDTTTAIPGGTGNFVEFFDYAISNDRIVFEGHQAAVEGSLLAGIFTNVCGTIERVIGPGDPLDGKTVSFVRIDEDSLDEDRLATNVSFTDGTAAIYVVDLTTIDHAGQGSAAGAAEAPTLEGIGCPALGATLTFHARGVPVGGTGFLVIGASPASIPIPGGGTLLVTPDWIGAVVAQAPNYGHPEGWLDFSVAVPNDSLFSGTTFHLQAAWMGPQPEPWRTTDRLEVSIP
ncbi:MAG: hypothetical protein ACF8XB_15985 [Planctomycetota bacterium JB042]